MCMLVINVMCIISWPFYCTDFCSALHQEMQGYVRVSAENANTPLKWSLGEDIE